MARRRAQRDGAAQPSGITKAGLPRKKFDENKVRRRAGRFADKPGAGDDAPRGGRVRSGSVAKAHAVFDKTAGRPRAEQLAAAQAAGINANTARTQLYHWQRARAQAALAGNPNPTKADLQDAAAQALGVNRVPSQISNERSWPGTVARRNMDRDKIQIDDSVLDRGLFRDKDHVRETTRSLLAGVPDAERLNVRWDYNPFSETIEMVAENKAASARVERRFSKFSGGGWSVDHHYFELPEKYQGGGNAKKMMRASVEEYDRLGVKQITVHANIDVGGYSWAKLGFAPDDPKAVRQAMQGGIKGAPRDPVSKAVKRVLDTSSDDELMFNLARTTGPDGSFYGKKVLINGDWNGNLDLTNQRHRDRLSVNLETVRQ